MKYLIAIDGGGTKTEAVLLNEQGHILDRNIQAGVNALDIGMELAQARVLNAIQSLAQKIPGGKIDVVYGGLAACVDYFPGVMHSFIAPRINCSKMRLEGDGGSLIAAVQGHKDGASLIAGTGSSLYIRSGDSLQRFGGWGPLIDTEGSGYKLGIHAFYEAFRSFDGRGEKTILYDLIKERLGDGPENCLPQIYEKGRPFISTFAPCVFEGRNRGDAVASRLFDEGVQCLADLVGIAYRNLGKEFNVYIGGGLFSAYPEYRAALELKIPKEAHLVMVDPRPVYGAAVEALWDLGIEADDIFHDTFQTDYDRICELQKEEYGSNSIEFMSRN